MSTERVVAIVTAAVWIQTWICEFKAVRSLPELQAYRAVRGQLLLLQCAPPDSPWLYSTAQGLQDGTAWHHLHGNTVTHLPVADGSMSKLGNSLWFSNISERHSGNYSCHTGDVVQHFLIDVVQQKDCQDSVHSEVTLIRGREGKITCPGLRCFTSDPSALRWYRNGKPVETDYTFFRKYELVLHDVHEKDNANFTCEASFGPEAGGMKWTARRTVRVAAIPPDTESPPRILYPLGNHTEEVELGKPHTLTCKVQFGFERNPSTSVLWWVGFGGNHGNGSLEPLQMDVPKEVERTAWEHTINHSAHLQQVTHRHLGATFICSARNSIDIRNATIRLKRRPAGLSLVIIGPVLTLAFATGVSILVRIYWLEIYLLYRAYLPAEDTVSEGKEFDAFVSCVSSSCSEQEDSALTGETLGLQHLPNVLEKQYGYRLCLLQRDLPPGGVYTEDVLWSIQHSRRVICVLSSCYLRSDCLFELEMGLKALREDPQLRLILVRNGHTLPRPTSLSLPPAVRRALRVLPILSWTPSAESRPGTRTDASCSNSGFWKALKQAMPVQPLPAPAPGEGPAGTQPCGRISVLSN
ncbi:hypothetical protein AGOR_G00057840 [Albula goreensis]|uniref:Uncharacterized protein n=1 Tax=Albula goreensis TaxID=1534307 RepID=A0A8T3DTF1_9TELE|nr:hypothetical protein AGOR_G00057840 [Albula goreensis]